MRLRKHLETSGPFVGLWVRTARALIAGGYKSDAQVRADIQAGVLLPYISIRDYGKYADAEVRVRLGLPTWQESWAAAARQNQGNLPASG